MKKVKIAGNILMVLAVIFVIRRITHISWNAVITPENIIRLILYTILYAMLIILSYIPWKSLVGVFTGAGTELKRQHEPFCFVFTKANIMKYVPGNVFQYVGRNEIATVLKLDHVNVASATVAEIILMVLAAGTLSIILIGAHTIQYLHSHLLQILLIAVAGLALVGGVLLILYKKKKEKLLKYLNDYKTLFKSRRSILCLFFCFLFYICTFLFIGFLFILVLRICVTNDLSPSAGGIIIGAFILSWLAGYITPGAPGGIGIRELLMTAIVAGSGIADVDSITTASAVYRVINILGDVLAFLIVLIVHVVMRNRRESIRREE